MDQLCLLCRLRGRTTCEYLVEKKKIDEATDMSPGNKRKTTNLMWLDALDRECPNIHSDFTENSGKERV